jgi:hypothetical protein
LVATNPLVQFRVQTFTPTGGFKPTKSYVPRLLWRDLDGNDQSKLLLTEAPRVLAIAVKGEPDPALAQTNAVKRSARRRRGPALAAERALGVR